MKKYSLEIGVGVLAVALITYSLLGSRKNPISENHLQTSQMDPVHIQEPRKLASVKKSKPQKKNTFQNKPSTKPPSSLSKILSLKNCLETERCNFPSKDSREYSLSVQKEIGKEVAASYTDWASHWSEFSNQNQSEILSLIEIENGFVKKEILSFLMELPVPQAREHVDLVLDHVVDYHDSNLINQGMAFLEKVKTESNEQLISERLSKAVSQGSPHVAQKISKNIFSFLTKETAELYKDVEKRLPASSPERTFLNSALLEFNMQQGGG